MHLPMLRDGAGKNWTQHIISMIHVPLSAPIWCQGVDLDGDGDADLVVADFGTNTISWFENHAHDHDYPYPGTSNNPNRRWTTHVIATEDMGVRSVFAIDIDGDGDVDLLSAARFDKTSGIKWYENVANESGLWEPHNIGVNHDDAYSVYAIDMDKDGDTDALSVSVWDSTVKWYENMDEIGRNWSAHEIATGAGGACSIFAIDMNGDDWIDVLSANTASDTVAW